MRYDITAIMAIITAVVTKLGMVTEDKKITVKEILEIVEEVVKSLGIENKVVVDLSKK